MKLLMKAHFKIWITVFVCMAIHIAKADAEEFPSQKEYINSSVEQTQLDREEWKKLKEDIDYAGLQVDQQENTVGAGNEKSGEMKETASGKSKNKNSSFTGSTTLDKILNIMLYVAVVVALAFLIYWLFVHSPMQQQAKINLEEELAPGEVKKSQLERMLDAALSEKQYRIAVRVYFLMVIKELSDKNWIMWEKKKTNFSYLLEMKERGQYQPFLEIVDIFERVWYGKREVDKTNYKLLEPKFRQFLQTVK
ncbi:MAG: hypothetical protein COA57_06055 [Flavobacteriales bacterium]|nr:MAG: hypothetical protein COA57_06055 [Flavobacteriales bacterium]